MKTVNTTRVGVANWTYLLMIALLYGASHLLVPIVGVGVNLWINELFWLMGLALFIVWFRKYSFRKTFSTKKTKKGVLLLSAVIGLSVWFPAIFIHSVADKILTLNFGPLPAAEAVGDSVTQILFLVSGLIILAPLCEEFFFRGLMQKAYDGQYKKTSWLIVGVLFGVFHIGNGVSDIFSATMLGILMGYLLYVTNSIWPSVVLHAFNNLTAVFLGQITLTLKESDSVPLWFAVIMITGIVLASILMLIIKKKYMVRHGTPPSNADHLDATNAPRIDSKIHGSNMLDFLPLVLAAVIFAGIGISEIRLRSNTLVSQMVDSGHNNISIGKTEADATIMLVEFELDDHNVYQFEWRNNYRVEYLHATFELIGPDGSVHHKEGPIFGRTMSVDAEAQQSIISGAGQWQFVITGELEGFELGINWTLRRFPEDGDSGCASDKDFQ